MSQLIRLACPNIFINLLILSVADMRKHRWPAHAYKLQDVLDAEKNNTFLVHPKSGEQESTLDLLYCGNPDCKKDRSGEKTRITYLPESLIKQLELLLASEDNAKVRNVDVGQTHTCAHTHTTHMRAHTHHTHVCTHARAHTHMHTHKH